MRKDVEIIEYTTTNGTFLSTNDPINTIAMEENYQRLNVLKAKFLDNKVQVIPYINEDWICCCESFNYKESIFCGQCGCLKENIIEMINYPSIKLVEQLEKKIKFNKVDSFETTINKYIIAIENKYGIIQKDVLVNLNMDYLIKEYK
ncbi:hypothetical protein B5F09_03160 [Erysipelatoclostridium sp. An173]|uniref:hypothetical protein n=1 Tax=Erysipelatoclostridium sp. An173 TaxID=1965571 RepID=UPI000B364CE9|nr:hypothetical protein [Erysipelatoclostridium sp. An173]OUP78432.1 hypothetical protein B5F09_03160 [Erysipelatoclostridium sp. An173]